MTQDPKLSAIAARIRALQAKTTSAGATEAEAIAAAAKARELLDKYQLDLSEIELRAEGTAQERSRRDGTEIADRLALRVGQYCDCKVWLDTGAKTVEFLGLKGDAIFAKWLLDSLVGFVQRKGVEFSLDSPGMPNAADVSAFVLGATQSINARLKAEIEARQAQSAAAALLSGTRGALVLRTKESMIAEAFARLGISLGRGGHQNNTTTRGNAFAAGQSAGQQAQFNRPVGQSPTLRIGAK